MERSARAAKRRAPSTSTSDQQQQLNPTPSSLVSTSPVTVHSRVTRSSTRQAAEAAKSSTDPPPSSSTTPHVTARPPPPASKKRKPPARQGSPEASPGAVTASPPRRSKRQKVSLPQEETSLPVHLSRGAPPAQPLSPTLPPTLGRLTRAARAQAAMSSSKGADLGQSNEPSTTTTGNSTKPSQRRSNRIRKSGPDTPASAGPGHSTRRSKKTTLGNDGDDVTMTDVTGKADGEDEPVEHHPSDEEDEEEVMDREDDYDEDEDEDAFADAYLAQRGHPPAGISSTLRALTGMISGVSSRLREILGNLRQKDDPSIQLIALQELSEILLVSTEDNLSGHFSPDQFVKELVALMEPDELGEDNPEMMLLACRCIANLMEALPSSTPNVVYGGAVPVLCQKLLEINYIDLAEQALSTLEKISVEFPASIVREGGLTACLTYLDFFATSTQRTAVTTAANCCRNIPEDSFPVVRDVMPILLNVLGSSDQKIVEQACLCVCRIVESFRYRSDKLEELVSPDLLRAITRLLLPGTTNLIGPNIHTQFLRVLSITARASPKLSVELFRMNIVDTLYQILTGVSPPNSSSDATSEIDSVVIMQALIHRPRDQVSETLNVICELLPGLPRDPSLLGLNLPMTAHLGSRASITSNTAKKSPVDEKIELLAGCREELKRFVVILLPTLTDAYSSTVNLGVRQKVLGAQLKMLSNLDLPILEDALRSVPYASFLGSILSQQDHPTLVLSALQAAELLIERMEGIYRYQFYREGVIAEISKLASKTIEKKADKGPETPKNVRVSPPEREGQSQGTTKLGHARERDGMTESQDPDDDSMNTSDEENEHDHEDVREDITTSPGSSQDAPFLSRRHQPMLTRTTDLESCIVLQARKFIGAHESGENGRESRERAASSLQELRTLSLEMENHFLRNRYGDSISLFRRLASYFVGDPLETITSYELLQSGIVETLVKVFSNSAVKAREEAQSAFLEVFMGSPIRNETKSSSTKPPVTPFSAVVHKLQDLLSRAEHFEVITVQQNSMDGSRGSAASMLSRQIRLRLVADEDSGIPRPFRNVMVSIHAIATFKALDDYLRPRISMSERPKGAKRREGVSHALAAFAAAAGIPSPHHRLAERGLASLGGQTPGQAPSTPPVSSTATSRELRKSTKTKSSNSTPANPTPANPPPPASAQEKPASSRRSSRRHQPRAQALQAPQGEASNSSALLECADERPVVDQNPDHVDDPGALDAILGDLNDGVEDESPAEPSAVNMEVASSGKITARKEDGTRIGTPSQVTASSSQSSSSLPVAASETLLSTPSSLHRHRSYAAAMQAIPQDWHVEFSMDDEPIPNEKTIYRAVFQKHGEVDELAYRNIWSAVHTIKFKRVQGPPPPETSTVTPPPDPVSESMSSNLPDSLDKNPVTSAILRLLKILHALNANLDDVMVENRAGVKLNAEPLAQFVNTKLTAKLNRQLEEPLIVASNCLPKWSEDLARLHPFLFPFETRHLFLQSTSFGYARSMARWQTAQSTNESRQDRHRDDRPFVGRLQRQKVRISRNRILESAVKVMELYGASPSVLEVEYFEEVGTGLGPTLEFYSTVSKEFSKKKLRLWRETESNAADEFAFGKRGLFPAPMSEQQAEGESGKKVLQLFKSLGKFVARSMLDSRIIDISFNPTFFRIGEGPTTVIPSLGAVKAVDEGLAKSLKLVRQFANAKSKIDEDDRLTAAGKVRAAAEIEIEGARVEDLGLDFTLPGYPLIELQENGSNIPVNIDNVGLYVDRVIDLTLGSGVQKQVDAFRAGFSSVFPYNALKAFTPDELVMLFGRVEEDWSIETLMDSIKADHGFNMDSKSVKNLLQTMSELSPSDRRQFLQFVTGSPKLPIGGFKSLTPMFTVVCKPSEPPYTSDDYLPSVMTCVNYLKLPDYTSMEIMRERLNVAIREGQGAFHLS